jgi:rubredoxin
MTEPAKEQTLAELAPARYECPSCGYVYEPNKGDSTSNTAAGTPFEDLPPTWRCPVCGARRTQFKNIGSVGAPSGFQENLGYGLGANRLTPTQKNLLIFGGLVLTFLFFMSFYAVR